MALRPVCLLGVGWLLHPVPNVLRLIVMVPGFSSPIAPDGLMTMRRSALGHRMQQASKLGSQAGN